MVITAALTAAASVGHPKHSTWHMKWCYIEHQLAELEEYYLERPPISNVTVRLMVEQSLKRAAGNRVTGSGRPPACRNQQ